MQQAPRRGAGGQLSCAGSSPVAPVFERTFEYFGGYPSFRNFRKCMYVEGCLRCVVNVYMYFRKSKRYFGSVLDQAVPRRGAGGQLSCAGSFPVAPVFRPKIHVC